MSTTAVICELNPIHFGHTYLIGTAKAAGDTVIAVMSGNFVERAIPAVADKYTRAETAATGGADLVVELPFPWCSAGAEAFADGGTAVAEGLKAGSLTFGSESGDIEKLKRAAAVRDSDEYLEKITMAEKNGRGTGSGAVFDKIMREFGVEFEGANDRLGCEYIRHGKKIAEFRAVKRNSEAAGSSYIREVIENKGLGAAEDMIPADAFGIFGKSELCGMKRYNELLFAYSRLFINENEDNDILRYAAGVARGAETAEEFTKNLATKKYTLARMRRELLFSIAGVTKENLKERPCFTVLLAASRKGREYLSKLNPDIPVITKPADTSNLSEKAVEQYRLHRKSDEIYAFLTDRDAEWGFRQKPFIAGW